MSAPQNAHDRGRPKAVLAVMGSIAGLNLVIGVLTGSAINVVLGAFFALAVLIWVESDKLRAALIALATALPRRTYLSAELQAMQLDLANIQSELESVLRELLDQLQPATAAPPKRSLHAEVSGRLTKVNADIGRMRAKLSRSQRMDEAGNLHGVGGG
jgi:hypothetical protein